MLDQDIKQQLKQYLELLEGEVTLTLAKGGSTDMVTFVEEIAAMSDLLKVERAELERAPSFMVGDRITFAGIPLGHEFTSFVMALLQASGRAPKITDEQVQQIKQLGKIDFTTYVSLSCHNCPDVVQALNIMSVVNPLITHTMVDGAVHKEEVDAKNIMAVPSVYKDGEFFESGRTSLDEILVKLGSVQEINTDNKVYDVLVVGGGPAGASAAIYAARKGISTGMVAERFGGQVGDTLGIENLIGTTYTEGPELVTALEGHVLEYNVDVIKGQRASNITRGETLDVELESGTILRAKSVILSTGARWRQLGIPGEQEFKNRGVAYCPHCDGPLFKGKRVAVIGGGNSGVEAAIDLAGIVGHVTVFEFMPDLKADKVLQDKLNSLDNVEVITNAQTSEIVGDERVSAIRYIDRATGTEHEQPLEGVFVQIGLVPNTEFIDAKKDRFGQIEVDSHGSTSMPGVFAAGDCTNSPYKQIIVSMGSGATAALGAFDYLIRN